ncbi:MAG: hypothetical protein AAF206_03975, partial [Bacteroidota bacterium]
RNRMRARQVSDLGWTLIRFFLAYTFVNYGMAKVIDMQFAGRLSSLDTPIVEMRPMSVAWSFFGYTYGYQAFVGWSQLAAAFLICFRRTSTLGAVLLLTVISNIVLVNFYYDVCVKLNSSIYLAMTIWVLLTDFPRLLRFFLLNETAGPRSYPTFFSQQQYQRLAHYATFPIVALVLLYPVWDTWSVANEYNIGERNAVFGAWEVTDWYTVAGDSTKAPRTEWEKIYFEMGDWGAVKKADDKQFYFWLELDEARNGLYLKSSPDDSSNYFSGRFDKIAEDSMHVRGILNPDSLFHDSLSIRLRLLKNYDLRKE